MPRCTSGIGQTVRDISEELGVRRCGAFHRDRLFVLAAASAVGFWIMLGWLLPVQPIAWRQVGSWSFVSLVVVQPCLEELVFRGLLQGRLSRWQRMQTAWRGFTAANGVIALLFTAGHFVNHPALWAAGVIVPALVFGFFRDRYASIWPGTLLHVFYNGGYFVMTGLPGWR